MGCRDKQAGNLCDAASRRCSSRPRNLLPNRSCLQAPCPAPSVPLHRRAARGWHQPGDAVVHRQPRSLFSLIYTRFALTRMKQAHRSVLQPLLLTVSSGYNPGLDPCSGATVGTNRARASDDARRFQLHVRLRPFHSVCAGPAQRGQPRDLHGVSRRATTFQPRAHGVSPHTASVLEDGKHAPRF